jgi:hypothetical protein
MVKSSSCANASSEIAIAVVLLAAVAGHSRSKNGVTSFAYGRP